MRVPIALDEVRQRHLIHGPIQHREHGVTQARRAYPVDDPIADAIDPVMPQHQVPVVRHADVQFQGVGPQVQGLRKALQGILARVVWGPAVADDEEIGPRCLRRPHEPAVAAGEEPPDPEGEYHAEHQTSPGGRHPLFLRVAWPPRTAAPLRPSMSDAVTSGKVVYQSLKQ